ncbi:unnamed protein product [Amoebophrya sp. A120]|nr:unnamed protein product [Amoebophrya sp. A120]|eukprot:GSA120T00019446001.1
MGLGPSVNHNDPGLVNIQPRGGCTSRHGQYACYNPCSKPEFETDYQLADQRLFQPGLLSPQQYQHGLEKVNKKVYAGHPWLITHRFWFVPLPFLIAGIVFLTMYEKERLECTAANGTCDLIDNGGSRAYDTGVVGSAIPETCCAYYCCERSDEDRIRLLEDEENKADSSSSSRPFAAASTWSLAENSPFISSGHFNARSLDAIDAPNAQCKVIEATENAECDCKKKGSGKNKDKEVCSKDTKIVGPHKRVDAVWWPLLIGILLIVGAVLIPMISHLLVRCSEGNAIKEILEEEWNTGKPQRLQLRFEYVMGGKHHETNLKVYLPVQYTQQGVTNYGYQQQMPNQQQQYYQQPPNAYNEYGGPPAGQGRYSQGGPQQPHVGQLMQGVDPATGQTKYFRMEIDPSTGQGVPREISETEAKRAFQAAG